MCCLGVWNTCQPTPNHELWNVNPQFINPQLVINHLQTLLRQLTLDIIWEI